MPGVVGAALLDRLREDLLGAYELGVTVRERNGFPDSAGGTAHHILRPGTAFEDLLRAAPLDGALRSHLGGPYVLNSFGGVLAELATEAYVRRVHRDVRSFSRDLRLMVNMLVMLDDFRPDNGATWILPGSHERPERPTDEAFETGAHQLLGEAGSVVLFDSNMWHAAGENTSGSRRWALTLTFSRPFMKPQFDYLTPFAESLDEDSDRHLAQVLGAFARVPASLEEWYQPSERRAYRPDQG